MRTLKHSLLSLAISCLSTVGAGCGGHSYLHLRDGTALECTAVEESGELDGWLAELSASHAVVLVDRERVRGDRPVTDDPGGDRVVDDADPGDSSRQLAIAATELVENAVAHIPVTGSTPSILFLRLENETERRFAQELMDSAISGSVGVSAEAVTGERRRALASAMRARFEDPQLKRADLDLTRFYQVDYVVLSQVTGESVLDEVGKNRFHYRLTFRLLSGSNGRETWSDHREWTVSW
jgi:hypothetical protein